MSDKDAETPVRFSLLEKTLSADFLADFPNYVKGLVRGDPGGFLLTQKYADSVDDYINFPMQDEDVWVVTFPKCGTTWTQEMVWMITHNCDTEAAKKRLFERSPFIEFPTLFHNDKESEEWPAWTPEKLQALAPPRIIKTHLPFYLLPPRLTDTSKVVYVVRNPKDVIVSYFHHHRLIDLHAYKGDIEKFADYFMNDEVYYAPFFGHILEGWAKKDHPNVLFLFYEDMKRNLRGEIDKVCSFLGRTLSEDQLQNLTKHLQFDSCTKNPAMNFETESGKFIRKGKTGDWKNHFSPELNSRIDQWIAKSLEGSDLKFTMELEYQD